MTAFDNENVGRARGYAPNSIQDGPWAKFNRRVESFKDYLVGKGFTFLRNVPAMVILIVLIILILLIFLLLWAVFAWLFGRAQIPQEVLDMQRTHSVWPPVENDRPLALRLVSSNALLPPNVSVCDGYGFSCTNLPNLVIGTLQRCDGVADCPDGSDEIGCKVCQTAFSCLAPIATSANMIKSQQQLICLRGSSLCDGVKDCADGSDENHFCRKTKCENASDLKCHGAGGLPMCLPESMVCDGDEHCRNAEDETNCVGKCKFGSKWCKLTKRCVPKWQICDGISNCADGSDEKDCNCKECCGTGKALCERSNMCLSRSRICDGVEDCPDGDDEKRCPGSCPQLPANTMDDELIQCSDGKRYSRKYACSGLLKQCEGKCSECDAESSFKCLNNTKCIPRVKLCDGNSDCGDNSDEANCDCDQLRRMGEVFQCGASSIGPNTKCIPARRRCDGYEDCAGGEDERNCDNCNSDLNAVYCNTTRTCFASTKRCFPRSRVCSPFSSCPHASSLDKLFCANKARVERYGP
ncbi:unnamed protein product [Anisakis simplex]|uniref:Uncharacterized protein n=1 Tax=Anisakis simplex TaxID=6269 RepID=A0A3P6QD65_ANISI|nr:unnamed protein product [Anisakis simplex]